MHPTVERKTTKLSMQDESNNNNKKTMSERKGQEFFLFFPLETSRLKLYIVVVTE